MKKIIFLANWVAVSINVFASPEGLTRLHRTDSFRFQLGMRDISETEVEKSSPSKNLRKRKRITYVQSDSWPQEKGDSQDFDYIPSQNIECGFEEVNPDSFVGDNHRLTEQPQEIDINQPFSYPNKKLKLKLNRDYPDKKLNVINNEDFFKKYRNFDNVEILVLTVKDLKHANKFEFLNLKELHIDILIKPAEQKKIEDSKKGNLKQPVLEEAFSEKNQEIWRNHRLEKEHKYAEKKRQSRINKKESTKQLLSEELPIFLSKNPDIERFSIQHISCKNLPMEIWNLKKLRSLTLKMTGITELSSEIQNLVNLEILDLSNNKIEALPEELSKLSNLRELNLYGNGFMKKFPNILVQSPNLEQLPNLEQSPNLEQLPNQKQLPNLEQLYIDKQQSSSWKKQLQKLQRINKKLKIEVW